MPDRITLSGKVLTAHFAHRDPLDTCLAFRNQFGPLLGWPPPVGQPKRDLMIEMASHFGQDHENEVVEELQSTWGERFASIGERPNDADKTQQIELTLEAMQQGKNIIHAGYLKMSGESAARAKEVQARYELPVPVVFWGEPDLLSRIDKPGCGGLFGDWYYEVADVKSSRTSKLPARLQVAFYSWLLADLQELSPDIGYVLPRSKEPDKGSVTTWEDFEIESVLPIAELFIREEYWRIALADPSTLVSTSGYKTPRTKLWADTHDLRGAKLGESDISLLPNMRLPVRRRLQPQGINTIHDLAELEDAQLAECVGPGATKSGLENQRTQAKVCVSMRPRWRQPRYHSIQDVVDALTSNEDLTDDVDAIPLDNEEIPFVHFDIEGHPFRNIEYLFGYQIDLPGRRPRPADSYEPVVQIWADEPTEAGEQQAFEQFLDAMEALENELGDLVIVHYGVYESTRLGMLADRHPNTADGRDNKQRVERLRRRLLDLYRLVQRAVYLPFASYSIKDVAPGLANLLPPGGPGRGHEWLNFADLAALALRMENDGWTQPEILEANATIQAAAKEIDFDVATILDASANRGMYWYEQFCRTGHPVWKYLTNIYNADDLVATQRLYDYLLNLDRHDLPAIDGFGAEY